MKQNEKGRSALELLSVLVVMTLIALAGLHLWNEARFDTQSRSIGERLFAVKNSRLLSMNSHSNERLSRTENGPYDSVLSIENGIGAQNKDWFWITVKTSNSSLCSFLTEYDIDAGFVNDDCETNNEVTFYFLKFPGNASTDTPDKDNQPKECPQHTICNENFEPIGCRENYFLHNGNCTQCPENNRICENGTFECKDGYYKDGNTCTSCGTGVVTCDEDGNPTECEDDYYLSGNSCVQCLTSSNCRISLDTTDANGCIIEAQTCSSGVCKTDGTCATTCNSGEYNSNGYCCSIGQKYENDGICTSCASGERCGCSNGTWDGEKCFSCPENSSTNVVEGNQIGDTACYCNEGYRLNGTVCEACTENVEKGIYRPNGLEKNICGCPEDRPYPTGTGCAECLTAENCETNYCKNNICQVDDCDGNMCCKKMVDAGYSRNRTWSYDHLTEYTNFWVSGNTIEYDDNDPIEDLDLTGCNLSLRQYSAGNKNITVDNLSVTYAVDFDGDNHVLQDVNLRPESRVYGGNFVVDGNVIGGGNYSEFLPSSCQVNGNINVSEAHFKNNSYVAGNVTLKAPYTALYLSGTSIIDGDVTIETTNSNCINNICYAELLVNPGADAKIKSLTMDGKFLDDSEAFIEGKLTVQNGVDIEGASLIFSGDEGVLVVENGDLNVPDGVIVGYGDATVDVKNGNLISGTDGYDGLQIKNLTVNGNVTTPSLRVDTGYSMRVSGSVNSPGYIMGNLTVCKGITAEWDYDYRGALHVGPSGSLSSGGTVSAIATGENANVETGLYIDGGILNARYARYFTSYSYSSSTGHTYGPTQTMSMPNYCPSWCTTNGYSCGN